MSLRFRIGLLIGLAILSAISTAIVILGYGDEALRLIVGVASLLGLIVAIFMAVSIDPNAIQ